MSNFEEYPLDANDVYVNGDPNLRYPQPPPSGGTDLDSLDLSTNESSDDDLFVTKEDGGTAWVKKSFLKIWNYISLKLGIFIGTNATWEALSQAEKDAYNLEFITDDSLNGVPPTAYEVPYNSTSVGNTLDALNSSLATKPTLKIKEYKLSTSAAGTIAISLPSGAQHIITILNTSASGAYYWVRYSETTFGFFQYPTPHNPLASAEVTFTILYY